jgi:hypothetical protein
MPYNWGPHYIVPSTVLKKYSGNVMLREEYDQDLLDKELAEMNLTGPILRISNPWYYRKKDSTKYWV